MQWLDIFRFKAGTSCHNAGDEEVSLNTAWQHAEPLGERNTASDHQLPNVPELARGAHVPQLKELINDSVIILRQCSCIRAISSLKPAMFHCEEFKLRRGPRSRVVLVTCLIIAGALSLSVVRPVNIEYSHDLSSELILPMATDDENSHWILGIKLESQESAKLSQKLEKIVAEVS